jgi:hypothetical protein
MALPIAVDWCGASRRSNRRVKAAAGKYASTIWQFGVGVLNDRRSKRRQAAGNGESGNVGWCLMQKRYSACRQRRILLWAVDETTRFRDCLRVRGPSHPLSLNSAASLLHVSIIHHLLVAFVEYKTT